jgi:hypothetical protein
MLAKFLPLPLLVALAAPQVRAQSGCPDPQATNYNPAATNNDGSCQYAPTTSALPLKTKLADAVAETSGLLYLGGKLWTLNDSGNTPVLFRVDSTDGHVVQQVRISNFDNVDWEDLTADAQYVYVGDFGNNNGDRRDLRILRVAQAGLGTTATTATAEAINFSYPDQTDFTPRTNQHNFDCEAFFFANDSLHLFTKLGRPTNALLHRARQARHPRGAPQDHLQREWARNRRGSQRDRHRHGPARLQCPRWSLLRVAAVGLPGHRFSASQQAPHRAA